MAALRRLAPAAGASQDRDQSRQSSDLAAPPSEQAGIGLLDQILGLMRIPNGAQEEAEQLVGVLGRHVGIG